MADPTYIVVYSENPGGWGGAEDRITMAKKSPEAGPNVYYKVAEGNPEELQAISAYLNLTETD